MPRSYKIEGIVIRRINYGEADRVITILSKTHGKLVILAKGIRKIRSRKAAHLELFNHCISYIAPGRNFDIVTESQTIDSFSHLRSDLERLAYSYRVIEIIDRLCPEREIHKNIYYLLLQTLRSLNDKRMDSAQDIVEQFTLQILWNLGYLPADFVISGNKLNSFLENVMERHLKSDSLLTKVSFLL